MPTPYNYAVDSLFMPGSFPFESVRVSIANFSIPAWFPTGDYSLLTQVMADVIGVLIFSLFYKIDFWFGSQILLGSPSLCSMILSIIIQNS